MIIRSCVCGWASPGGPPVWKVGVSSTIQITTQVKSQPVIKPKIEADTQALFKINFLLIGSEMVPYPVWFTVDFKLKEV